MKRKIVGYLLGGVVVLGLLSIVSTLGLTALGTIRITSVETDAMNPAIRSGALVVSTRTPISEVKAGDVISVRTTDGNSQDVLGRVTQISNSSDNESVYEYSLQSDANLLPDPWAYKATGDTYKLAANIPLAGYVVQAFKEPISASIFLILIAALAFVYVRFLHAPESLATKTAKQNKILAAQQEKNGQDSVAEILALFDPTPELETGNTK